MRRFDRVPEPSSWQQEAETPGRAWLAAHPYSQRSDPSERPPDYYTGKNQKFRQALKRGFLGLCAYSALTVPVGTVDHFEGWADVRGTSREHLYYTWSNLRYCVDWVNSAKKGRWPDPHEVMDDWFELILPSLEIVSTSKVPLEMKDAVDKALQVLGKSQNAIDARTSWWELYRYEGLPFKSLKKNAPLLARALLRQPAWLTKRDRRRFIDGKL